MTELNSPQEARAALNHAVKTSLYMTCSIPQWRHFFDMRLFGKTGEPHPDMKKVAAQLYADMATKF